MVNFRLLKYVRTNKCVYTNKNISDHIDLLINGCATHVITKHVRSKQAAFSGEDKKQNTRKIFVFLISLLIVAQHVSGNHVLIIRS